MARSAEMNAREAKIAELKQLISNVRYESDEMLEDAVDRFLWAEQDRLQQQLPDESFADDNSAEDDSDADSGDDNAADTASTDTASNDTASKDIVRSHPK